MSAGSRTNFPVHYSATAYDRFTAGFLAQFDRLLVKRLAQEVRANPAGRRLLDVGCGTGQFLLQLAVRAEFNHLAFAALDYYHDMIVASRTNFLREGLLDRVALVQGDVHRLPLRNGSLDFVISRSTLHHWADPTAALLEIRRVLLPGGVALIHEIRRDPDPAALQLFNRLRNDAGVEASRLKEKYTLAEIRSFVAGLGLPHEITVSAPAQGAASLGCEIRIEAAR